LLGALHITGERSADLNLHLGRRFEAKLGVKTRHPVHVGLRLSQPAGQRVQLVLGNVPVVLPLNLPQFLNQHARYASLKNPDVEPASREYIPTPDAIEAVSPQLPPITFFCRTRP